jgi:CubicO group peptidase (beta-lactamase class C family)
LRFERAENGGSVPQMRGWYDEPLIEPAGAGMVASPCPGRGFHSISGAEYSMRKKHPSQKIHRISRREFLGLAGVTLAAACAPTPPLLAETPTIRPGLAPRLTPVDFPNGEWPTTSPNLQGIDPGAIEDMRKKIGRESLPVHSFLLVRNGFLVSEIYFPGFDREEKHALYSCTKSVTSALIGRAIGEGLIQGVDQKVLDFFPEKQEKADDSNFEELTIEHLLTMTLGHRPVISPAPADSSSNWVDLFFDQSFTHKPGTVFQYDPFAPYMLSAILQKAAGKTAADYLREKLFDPLGIRDFTWPADAQGVNYGNSHMELRPIDMAKFGYLFVNEGNWDGRQLISKEWVQKSTAKHLDTKGKMNSAEDFGYGYLWWMNSFEGYSAHGSGGQYIFVIPGLDVVAVFTAGFDEKTFTTPYSLMRTLIIPGI